MTVSKTVLESSILSTPANPNLNRTLGLGLFSSRGFKWKLGKFENGSITISNLKTEEEDKFHFSFDVNIKTHNFSLTYNFGEVACFNMYNVIDGKQTKLQDENFMGNFLEFKKDFFSVSINEGGAESNVKLNFNQFEDQEILFDFLNELNAWCETLIRR